MSKSVRLGAGGDLQGHGGLGTTPLLSIASPTHRARGDEAGQGKAQPRGQERNHPHHFMRSSVPTRSRSVCRPATPTSSSPATHLLTQ